MKKILIAFSMVVLISGFAMAAKKRKVVKAASPASETASKSSAKLEDVEQTKKKPLNKSLQTWLEGLKKQISKTYSPAKSNQLVAVAAVRGDETVEAPPLYWKGKKPEGLVALPEIKEFDTAIETAMSGDTVAAKEKLQAFVATYPQSTLVADANQTLAMLDEPSTVNP